MIHLVDISGQEGRTPWDDYSVVVKELKLYSRELAGRPQIIALNKTDLPGSTENIKAFRRHTRKKTYDISALTGDGVKKMLNEVYKLLKRSLLPKEMNSATNSRGSKCYRRR